MSNANAAPVGKAKKPAVPPESVPKYFELPAPVAPAAVVRSASAAWYVSLVTDITPDKMVIPVPAVISTASVSGPISCKTASVSVPV